MPNNLIIIDLSHWRRDSSRALTFDCPECGRSIDIGNRVVDGKGIIYDPLRCPWNRINHPELKERMDQDDAPDCDFHGMVRLEGWPVHETRLTQPPEQLIP